jgi:hypothetical protein
MYIYINMLINIFVGDQHGKRHRFASVPHGDGKSFSFHRDHRFDEVVWDGDAKLIDPKSEAVINHIQFFR